MGSDHPVGGAAAGDDAGDCSRLKANELGGEPTSFAADLGAAGRLPFPRSRMVGSFAPLIFRRENNVFPEHTGNGNDKKSCGSTKLPTRRI